MVAESFAGMDPKAPARDARAGEPLDMLGEEATEVAKEVFKAHRFGLDGRSDGYDGPTPRERITQEVGDLLASVEILVESGVLDPVKLMHAVIAKHRKLSEKFKLVMPKARVEIKR